jgi:hypothetical protein
MIIFGVGQYLLLGYVNRVTEGLRTKKVGIRVTFRIVVVVQFVVSGVLGLMILQMIFSSHYSTRLTVVATIISYVPACVIMF